MSATATESSPLIPQKSNLSTSSHPRPQRTVTFNPTVTSSSAANSQSSTPGTQSPKQNNQQQQQSQGPQSSSTATGSSQPVLASLSNKLRRRHSQGAATALAPPALSAGQRIGPQRTTKTAQKLKILPNPEHGEDGSDEESGRDVYAQFTRIKDPTARRDAARLGREDRTRLPRVTAYCTASSLQLDGLMTWLKRKSRTRGAAPKLFDECIYSPYNHEYRVNSPVRERSGSAGSAQLRRYSDSAVEVDGRADQMRENLIDLGHQPGEMNYESSAIEALPGEVGALLSSELEHARDMRPENPDFDIEVHTPEVFLFGYGTVVIWGMTLQQEQRFLKEIAHFEVEKLAKDDVQTEDFNFYYTREYQARIYNDFISLRDKKNYMTKLAISHALSQSVKTSLYEDLVDNTIESTKEVPAQIALTGKVNLTRREINMQIGELFILRINIHLQGSVLDAPELMWSEPQLDPVYQAVRSYLEMDQRVGLLTERLDVIADLLAVLKDQLTHTHGEYLEWIVIVLIAAEIIVAAVNIVVDLYAGVD